MVRRIISDTIKDDNPQWPINRELYYIQNLLTYYLYSNYYYTNSKYSPSYLFYKNAIITGECDMLVTGQLYTSYMGSWERKRLCRFQAV